MYHTSVMVDMDYEQTSQGIITTAVIAVTFRYTECRITSIHHLSPP